MKDDFFKSEEVSDLYEKIQDESGGLESLLQKIPGLKGYMERGKRRKADQLLRETVASRLEQTRVKFSQVQQELSRDIVKAMDHAEPLGRVDTKLAGLIGKLEAAPVGYAGFFDAVKVKEDDLARIYAFDEQVVEDADNIDTAVTNLSDAVINNGDINNAIRTLDQLVTDANNAFAQRDEVIKGIQ
ncbi:MAG TPA: hypothetical protein EYP41_06925 [Anaerolineae bacterium]|nr:hypothetical protein [Anaerolineae bacterium]